MFFLQLFYIRNDITQNYEVIFYSQADSHWLFVSTFFQTFLHGFTLSLLSPTISSSAGGKVDGDDDGSVVFEVDGVAVGSVVGDDNGSVVGDDDGSEVAEVGKVEVGTVVGDDDGSVVGIVDGAEIG